MRSSSCKLLPNPWLWSIPMLVCPKSIFFLVEIATLLRNMRFYSLGFWGVVHFQRKPSSCVGYNKSTYVESTLLIMFVPYFSRLIFPMHKFSLLNFATFLLVHSPYIFFPRHGKNHAELSQFGGQHVPAGRVSQNVDGRGEGLRCLRSALRIGFSWWILEWFTKNWGFQMISPTKMGI